jgi:hypothetical protein
MNPISNIPPQIPLQIKKEPLIKKPSEPKEINNSFKDLLKK